jgi:hypothetical protein
VLQLKRGLAEVIGLSLIEVRRYVVLFYQYLDNQKSQTKNLGTLTSHSIWLPPKEIGVKSESTKILAEKTPKGINTLWCFFGQNIFWLRLISHLKCGYL